MIDVVVVFGSESDLPEVQKGEIAEVFDRVGVSYQASVVSAHRNLDELIVHCRRHFESGTRLFIGIAGMAAVLPSVIVAITYARAVVIGVPMSVGPFQGIDALLSMVSLPSGVPVLVAGVGAPGLKNAALAACQILAMNSQEIGRRLDTYLRETRRSMKIPIDIHDPREAR